MLKPSKSQQRLEQARKAENSFIKRSISRYFPFILAVYGCFYLFEGVEILKNVGLLVLFYFLIEFIYFFCDRDNWILTVCAWLAWGWFYYSWIVGDSSNIWSAMVAPIIILLSFGRILIYWNWYQKIKHKPHTEDGG